MSWVDRISNQDIFCHVNKKAEIVKTIKNRILQYFGHLMQNYAIHNILHLVVKGKIIGKETQVEDGYHG